MASGSLLSTRFLHSSLYPWNCWTLKAFDHINIYTRFADPVEFYPDPDTTFEEKTPNPNPIVNNKKWILSIPNSDLLLFSCDIKVIIIDMLVLYYSFGKKICCKKISILEG